MALITSRIWLDREQAAAGETRVTVVTRAASELQLRIPEAVSIRTVRTADGLLPFRREGTATAVLLPGNLRGGPVTIEWQTRNRQSTVPLMTLASGKAPPHLVELVGAAESGWLAVDPLSSETAAIIEMQALLEALESQSSRSFRIDDPLLARLRTLDARINRSEDPRAEQLRATWRRLTGLIAVRTDEPGRVPAAIADPSVDLLQTAVTLPQERAGQPFPLIRLRRRPAVESADIWFGLSLVAAVILLFMLSRRGIPRRIADELAKQPGLACLVIGVPWVVYLSPRPIGILLIAVGLFLLIRSTRLSRRLSGASTR